MVADVEHQVVAAHPEDRDALRAAEAVGVDVLAAEGEDRLADGAGAGARPAASPNAACAAVAPRLGRLVGDLDDLGDQGEGVGVQAGDRRAVQRLGAEQDGLAEPEVVDPADVGGASAPSRRLAELPPETTSSAMPCGASTCSTSAAELAHVRVVGHDAVLAGQVGAEADQPQRPGGRATARTAAGDVVDGDALAQVAELDHQHHAVGRAWRRRAARRARRARSASVFRLTSAARDHVRRPG